ncbi:MAG TPA: DUF2087 domain-containing protein [Candidatus Dormibacteraeota bacterium]|jgi:hypothetical protein
MEDPKYALRVLRTFMPDGRLLAIPAKNRKRRVVLSWLADHFRPAERYPESVVNEILSRYHPDYATLRRYLVDEELMHRQDGLYWRAGTLPYLR